MSNNLILIADDDDAIRTVIEKKLQRLQKKAIVGVLVGNWVIYLILICFPFFAGGGYFLISGRIVLFSLRKSLSFPILFDLPPARIVPSILCSFIKQIINAKENTIKIKW